MTSVTPTATVKQIYKDLGRADKGREPSIKLLYVTPERLGNSDSMLSFMHSLNDQVSRHNGKRPRSFAANSLSEMRRNYWESCLLSARRLKHDQAIHQNRSQLFGLLHTYACTSASMETATLKFWSLMPPPPPGPRLHLPLLKPFEIFPGHR